MQHKNSKKSKLILKAIAEVIQETRIKQLKSQRLVSDEYDLQRSLLSRIENGVNEPKIISLWSISEALDIKISELFKLVEKKLPENFSLIDS